MFIIAANFLVFFSMLAANETEFSTKMNLDKKNIKRI